MAIQTALEILAQMEEKPFKPSLKHYTEGNFLTYFANEKECIAKQLDSRITVYYADDELVGFRVNL